MRAITRTVSGAVAADPDGIAISQTFSASVALTLAASTLSPPRRLVFDATADISAVVFTIVGVDRFGNAITETVTGVTTTAVTTTRVYARVTSITPSAGGAADEVFVGWGDEVISAPIMHDHKNNPFNVTITARVTGTVDYTVEHTLSDLQAAGTVDGDGDWFPHSELAGDTASADGTYAFPVRATRYKLNSGSGQVVFRVMQSGV